MNSTQIIVFIVKNVSDKKLNMLFFIGDFDVGYLFHGRNQTLLPKQGDGGDGDRSQGTAEDVFGRSAGADEDDALAELYGDEQNEVQDEEEGENLFGDDMERDYRPQPELDVYSQSGMDDASELAELSEGARRAAEREMDERDNLMDEDALLYEREDEDIGRRARIRRRRDESEGGQMEVAGGEEEEEEIPIDILENLRGRSTRQHWAGCSSFKSFIRGFKDPKSKKLKYLEAVNSMVAENRESLEVDYDDLASESGEQNICYFLPEAPLQVLGYMDRAVTEVTLSIFPFFPRIAPEVKVRIRGLPIDEDIRMLRQLHLNMLVRTSGVVTITTGMHA
ncbi:unnamed protein product [Gongylonema pulchrum]|uniref:MCM_N domain-containing protein n=1 Tax=Gongylonema pulchrum TaxID=637853 RepID=A0A183EIQ2_9BILA|nr:unnamed protein product [Gongylonema pulchrum]